MTGGDDVANLIDCGELQTERLILRLPDASHAPALSEYHRRNAKHFAPYSPRRHDGFHNTEAWRRRALDLRQTSLAGAALHLLLLMRADPAIGIVGDVNINHVMRGAFHAAYLGYQLDHAHWGRGLMSEALSACIAHVFGPMNLHRLMANYVPTNERSGRLLRKLGFSVEGYARDYLLLDGEWKDHVLTSLVNPDFREEMATG